MKISEQLKERFCKDCKIPIHLFIEPYFTYKIDQYDIFYDSKFKWERYVKELEKYDDEQKYFEDYRATKDKAIQSIKESRGYSRFITHNMSEFKIQNNDLPSKDVYKLSNIGNHYFSIDMVKANFSSLSYYSRDIFMDCNTWEQYISNFTNNEHIIGSKYIRQVILGNCNAKRQVTYEKYLMCKVLNRILNEEKVVCRADIDVFSNDEIVINVTNRTQNDIKTIKNKLDIICSQFDFPLKLTEYILHGIDGVNGYYQEIINNDDSRKYVLKSVNGYNIPFIICAFKKQDVTDLDKTFMQEGRLAKFIEIPKVVLLNDKN